MISIEYSAGTPNGIRPRAEAFLSRYDQERFHNLRLRLRPPSACYSLSIAQVWLAFLEVLDELDRVLCARSFATDHEWDQSLLKKVEHLLYVLAEHLEDCDRIVRSCFQSEAEFANNEHAKQYRSSVRPYRSHVACIVNAIKHEQGRLRSLVFYGDTYITPGYFLEGIQSDGAVGPDSRVHEGGDTAFSYAYDLRLHFVFVVTVSSLLAKAVEAVAGVPDHPPEVSNACSDLRFREIAQRLARFSRVLFPDEYFKPFPGVQLLNALGQPVLHVSFPCDTESGKEPDEEICHVNFSYMGDGVTKSFTIPYKLASRGFISGGG